VATGIVVCGYGGPDAGDSLPFPAVRRILGGDVLGWLVGGQEYQLGSTRTPSPAVAVVAGEPLVLRVVACIYLGGGKVAHGTIGPDRQIARNPPRPAVPLWGGDIARAPGCSLGLTICCLWGDTQPSRLTCSRKPVATDRIGTPAKSGGTSECGSLRVLTLCG
jgi:hypothetical protein